MKPVYQTRFGAKKGNCWQAAIASLLELNLDAVPDFMQLGTLRECEAKVDEFFRGKGLLRVHFGNDWVLKCYHFAIGPGPRTPEVDHIVVAYGNNIVHDPHPDGAGLETISYREYLVLIDPAIHEKN